MLCVNYSTFLSCFIRTINVNSHILLRHSHGSYLLLARNTLLDSQNVCLWTENTDNGLKI